MATHINLLSVSLKGKGWISTLSLIFFLLSCSPSPSIWHFDQIITKLPSQNSARVHFTVKTSCYDVQLEITRSFSGNRMYINVFSLPIPCIDGDETKALLKFTLRGEEGLAYVERFYGGQRILIPDETANDIINSLLIRDPVSFSIGRYKATLEPLNFKKCYENLLKAQIY